MRAPRLIAIVLGLALAATAIRSAVATGASPLVIVLLFFSGFVPYLFWLTVERYVGRDRIAATTNDGDAVAETPSAHCARCGRAIVVDPAASHDMFEGMHWLCFHLEFEHDGDADLPCLDAGCPHWILQVYEAKLRELGADPRQVFDDAVAERYR